MPSTLQFTENTIIEGTVFQRYKSWNEVFLTQFRRHCPIIMPKNFILNFFPQTCFAFMTDLRSLVKTNCEDAEYVNSWNTIDIWL